MRPPQSINARQILPRLRGFGGRNCPTVAVTKARASFVVVGVTEDASGTPLGNMTVFLLRAGGMALVSSGTSDGSGNYALPTPDNAGNFVVVSFHPNGSLAGVTRPVLVAQGI